VAVRAKQPEIDEAVVVVDPVLVVEVEHEWLTSPLRDAAPLTRIASPELEKSTNDLPAFRHPGAVAEHVLV
jgi:hypothetical protein